MKAPGSRHMLQRRVADAARRNGMAVDRYNRWISYMALCGVLQRGVEASVIPIFYVKGGVALELRFGNRARASKDLDVGLLAGPNEMLTLFDKVLDLGFDDFRFTRKGDLETLPSGAIRIDVAITYHNRPWGTVDIDLSRAEADVIVEVIEGLELLREVGLSTVSVPCLAVEEQIAQKIHAMTEPLGGRENPRFRDLIDINLLEPLIEDHTRLLDRLETVFSERGTHAWPPEFTLPESWRAPLAELASELGLKVTPDELASSFTALLLRILGIEMKERFEYRFLRIALPATNFPEAVRATDVEEVNSLANEGWRVIESLPARDSGIFIVLLERANGPAAGDDSVAALSMLDRSILPRLQLRLEPVSESGREYLRGHLRNVGGSPANKVRVIMTGVENHISNGTVAQGDEPLPISIRYDDQEARRQPGQFPSIIVQFRDDDGRKWEQSGDLFSGGRADASGRYTYRMLGLGPVRATDKFLVKHDILEDLSLT